MNIILSKFLASSCLFGSAIIGCFIPSIIRKSIKNGVSESKTSKKEGIMCLCNCLAAGFIMGMSFLHMFPETVEQCSSNGLIIMIKENKLNLAFVIMLSSFSIMLFLERVLSFGRTPCCSVFNDCKDDIKCCVSIDEESLVSCGIKNEENISHAEHCKPCNSPRYKHKHSQILATIKNLLCPICDCNGLCITLALFLHSVFEGLVVGLEDHEIHMWLITLAIVLHKWAAGMALASFLVGNTKSTVYALFSIFCFGSPLGVLIGSLILDSNLKVIGVLNSIALGTLVYVGFEIIVHELFCEIKCKRTALYKWISFIIGIAFIFSTLILEFLLSNHDH
ncbi:zinc-transport protein, putative [Theileria annulata]|uniref:Zinc-transport protein, putative n=1 Tax=Theileria annulata TaxID=5874 RepID=Q4UB25_THEAN|nr:zinc-transport protein, putative [Theileria annulata]CAI75976.1 zinc-transport protein, putative [Theileria annulata]|eukprot:XP_955452.1 zinc-transport protein, putative [Theileria annulata]